MSATAIATIVLLTLATFLLLVFRSQLLHGIAAKQKQAVRRYPYCTRIALGTLSGLYRARLVERQLNRMEATCAFVDYAHRQAVVYTQQHPDLGALASTLEQSGCRAVSFSVERTGD